MLGFCTFLFFFTISSATTGEASESSLCLRELQGWKGKFYFPDLVESEKSDKLFYTKGEDMNKNCVFYMNTYGTKTTVLTFSRVELGRAEITIKQLLEYDGEKSWEFLHLLSGNIPGPIQVRVTERNKLKLIVPKNAGSFKMEYELITFPPPEPMLETLACTKDYSSDSHCVFQCSDGFHPAILDEPRVHAHCTRDLLEIITGNDEYEWITSDLEFEEMCVNKTVVEETCYKDLKPYEKNQCPYSFDDLLRLMEEEFEVPEEKVVTPTVNKLESLEAVGAAANRNTITLGKPIHPKCVRHCKRSFSTARYTPSCGSLKKKRAKKVCMECRYGPKKYCAASSIFV